MLFSRSVTQGPKWAWSSDSAVDDLGLVERLIAFYRSKFSKSHYGGMWAALFTSRHQAEHAVFMTGSTEECAALLRNPMASDMQYGFELTTRSHAPGMASSLESQENQYKVCRAALVALAESIGAIRLPPEHGPRIEHPSNDDLVKAVEKVIGRIAFPNPFAGEFGVLTRRGIASFRAIQAVYQAWRIKKLSPGNRAIAEIGAGLGRTAYNAYALGARDYTIIDLPFTCLSSGYFLGRCLGENAISLAGDSAGPIKFIGPTDFLRSDASYDLVVNVDSITELAKRDAEAYACAIRKRSDGFFSINHETNEFTVRELMGEGDRHLYPFRNGYTEEFFHVNRKTHQR